LESFNPGFGGFGIEKADPGSGTNIPDPHHWEWVLSFKFYVVKLKVEVIRVYFEGMLTAANVL
jgi:hypothetical protein